MPEKVLQYKQKEWVDWRDSQLDILGDLQKYKLEKDLSEMAVILSWIGERTRWLLMSFPAQCLSVLCSLIENQGLGSHAFAFFFF